MSPLINIFWFIRELKYILFWLYLWQLKEYHVGRFVDHFRTEKGKKLLFNYGQAIKAILIILLIFWQGLFNFIIFALFLFYAVESLFFLKGIITKSAKSPKLTFKILFLAAVSLTVVALFLAWNSRFLYPEQLEWLLAFDILTPLIISSIVLLFQPFFVVIRNIKLQRAKRKINKIKSLSGLKVIAITGSYGKTSTKEFLTTILSKKFKVLSTKEHQNSEAGIAKCILDELKPSHKFFIVEVGAYNKGKVKEVCSVIKPAIGIVTGVNEQHLALFGSMQNLLSAEGGEELAAFLEKDGLLVVNGDNKHCLDLVKKFNGREKIYSQKDQRMNSEIWTEEIEVAQDYIYFIAADKNREMGHFKVNVLGKQNVQNLLAAILVARELGMNFGEISDACKDIRQEQAGMLLKHGKHGIKIVDSSYSANPDGVFADLEYFSILGGKKVIVMPCLIELGKKSTQIHEKIGRKISEVCDFAIITTKDHYADIKRGFDERGNGKRILLCDNPQEISSAVTLFCKSGDAVLLEGRVPPSLGSLLE